MLLVPFSQKLSLSDGRVFSTSHVRGRVSIVQCSGAEDNLQEPVLVRPDGQVVNAEQQRVKPQQ